MTPRWRAAGNVSWVILAFGLAAFVTGCGGGSSPTAAGVSSTTPTVARESNPTKHCVELWSRGRISEFGGRQQLAQRVLLTTEGRALVTTDSSGICLVAFPESAGSEPGGGGGLALTFSYERGVWGLYLLLNHEEAPINPAEAEEDRGPEEQRDELMHELGRRVETEPNAVLSPEGTLTELSGAGAAGEEGEVGSVEEVTACQQVVLEGSGEEFPVYMSTIGVSCDDALDIVDQTLFRQGAPPPDGFECTGLTSEAGRCVKGGEEIVYSKLGGKTSMPLQASEGSLAGGSGAAASTEAGASPLSIVSSELLEAVEEGQELEPGVKREISDVRLSENGAWAAATLVLLFPGQGPDGATGVFERVEGGWSVFEIGSSFAGDSHCPPPAISAELEVSCANSRSAPTAAGRN
jgi:hypothetical protein